MRAGKCDIQLLSLSRRLVAIDKPAWMLSVPGRGPEKQDCAAARVRAMFPEATGPLVVHRLDMETSGVLVFGLDADAQRCLSMQFERRQVEKRYIALVRSPDGGPLPDAGEISLPIRADLDRRPIQIVDHARGDASTTRFRVLERAVPVDFAAFPATEPVGAPNPGEAPAPTERVVCDRIEFEPLTGRTHQLRVHAATPREQGGLGASILGDSLYGPERAMADAALRPQRLFLHASRLVILDPDSMPAPAARRPGRGAQTPRETASGSRLIIDSPPPF